MKKTGKVLNSLEDYILAAMLMVMTILAFINVIMRYVLLSSLPWIEELNRLGLVILSYTGAAVALKNHSHLGLSIVTDKLSPKGKKIAGLFSCLCGVFFCGISVYYGVLMVIKEYQNNVLTQGMQWPEWLFGIWLPIGLAVLCIRFIQWGVHLVQGRDFKDTSKEGNNG